MRSITDVNDLIFLHSGSTNLVFGLYVALSIAQVDLHHVKDTIDDEKRMG